MEAKINRTAGYIFDYFFFTLNIEQGSMLVIIFLDPELGGIWVIIFLYP